VGYAIHHAASIFWAILHEKLRPRLSQTGSKTAAIAPAIVTTAAAYVVDFYVIPKRLTPGFEHRLSKRSLFMVYGTFALGLATVALMDRHGGFNGSLLHGIRQAAGSLKIEVSTLNAQLPSQRKIHHI
jgi:hypothetical protein